MKKIIPLSIGIVLGSIGVNVNAEDLLQVYQQAKQFDSTILQAAANRDAAFSTIGSARANLLPQIDLSAGYNINKNSDADDTNTLSAGVKLNQQIYNNAVWVGLDLSELEASRAEAVYASSQQDLILRVTNAYFNVLRAIDNLDFIRAEKKAVARQLEQTKQRFEVGLSAITDVHDAQAQYDSVLAQEILAENSLTNSYEDIREITGREYKRLNKLNTKTFSATRPKQSIDVLVEQAGQENLTLLASRIARESSKLNIEIEQSGHLPSLTFNAGYDFTDTDTNQSSNNRLNAGINFSLPIYSGGGVSAKVDQAKFNYIASSEAYEGAFRSTIKNVRAFYNNTNASIGSLRAFSQTVVSARSALEATEAGFEVGTRTIVDVLDATRRLFDANKNLANARYDYIINEFQLRQAVGTLSEQDIVDINKGLNG